MSHCKKSTEKFRSVDERRIEPSDIFRIIFFVLSTDRKEKEDNKKNISKIIVIVTY